MKLEPSILQLLSTQLEKHTSPEEEEHTSIQTNMEAFVLGKADFVNVTNLKP